MNTASARLTLCLLVVLFVTFSVARTPLDTTGTANKHHVTATRSQSDVTGDQSSTGEDGAAIPVYSPYDHGKLQTGSGNRKQKDSEVDGLDYSKSLSDGSEWTKDGTRQKRYADWPSRKKYGGLVTRSARSLAGVGWNKRPRYSREDGPRRDWRNNMMRVWGKRSGRLNSRSAIIWSLIWRFEKYLAAFTDQRLNPQRDTTLKFLFIELYMVFLSNQRKDGNQTLSCMEIQLSYFDNAISQDATFKIIEVDLIGLITRISIVRVHL